MITDIINKEKGKKKNISSNIIRTSKERINLQKAINGYKCITKNNPKPGIFIY